MSCASNSSVGVTVGSPSCIYNSPSSFSKVRLRSCRKFRLFFFFFFFGKSEKPECKRNKHVRWSSIILQRPNDSFYAMPPLAGLPAGSVEKSALRSFALVAFDSSPFMDLYHVSINCKTLVTLARLLQELRVFANL